MIVETAIAIPVLVTVTLTLLWAVGAVMTGLSLGDACDRIGREVSRGADAAATVAEVQTDRPAAQFDLITLDGGDLKVIGRERVGAPGLLRGLGLTVTREVVVARELSIA